MVRRTWRSIQLAQELAWLPVNARIERRLGDLAERFGRPVDEGTLVALPLSQEDLAHLAGTSRESANRALRHLITDGRLAAAARGRYIVRRPLSLVDI
jgi:CRP-like cAMP-binding protein